MDTLICSACACPPVPFWGLLNTAEHILIDQYEHYRKRTNRNRYFITAPNGVQMLSIPLVKGKNESLPMRDVMIAYDEPWIPRHIQAIRSSYGKSPYFEFYFDKWTEILERENKFLLELNIEMIEYFKSMLKLDISVELTDRYYEKGVFNIDIRDKIWKAEPLSAPDTKFYTQVWEHRHGHYRNLSVIDLLFCSGPEAKGIINQMTNFK
jgi:hypothetical protein